MWHWYCVVDVLYPRLSDWTHLQWALLIVQLVAHEVGEFILHVRVAMQLFTNYFGGTG